MGYHETFCQLCGVSFAIARLRRADEPEEAAWSYEGSAFVDVEHEFNGVCGEGSGCTVSDREGNRPGEHLTGPGCVSGNGYSGHRVSLVEMKGCRAVQCLVKKDADWIPEEDDQDFELEGDYFLTGIGDGSPDVAPLEDIEPVRHGVSRIYIANTEADDDCSLPFHPTCFEIYKRACEIRIGRVDLEGLYHWRHLDCDYETFFVDFPRDPAVRRGQEQFWDHERGCEYLVANPINIPGLSQLLEPPVHGAEQKTTFGASQSPNDSQTEIHRTPLSTPNAVKDPFSPLPAEITSMILDHLGSKDIANLRLATPVFRQLPTILFRRLLLEDMTWLYEVKELDVAEFDWYSFYCTLKSSWKDLKGLRNRERIWQDVEEILGRIEEYRKKGEIPAQ